MNYIGVDFGASGYKCVASLASAPGDARAVFMPARVCTPAPHAFSMPTIPGILGASDHIHVRFEVNRTRYHCIVGRTAHLYGNCMETFSHQRFAGEIEVRALWCATLTKTILAFQEDRTSDDDAVPIQQIVIGLPLETWRNSDAIVQEAAQWIRQQQTWQASLDNGKHFQRFKYVAEHIHVLPQVAGALYDYALEYQSDRTKGARLRAPIDQLRVGIISIGFNTVELSAYELGQQNVRMSSSMQYGVRNALREFDRDQRYTLLELDAMLRNGQLDQARLDSHIMALARRIQGLIDEVWGNDTQRLDFVLLTGGGALLQRIMEQMHGRFGDRLIAPSSPEDAIYGIARGFHKMTVFQVS